MRTPYTYATNTSKSHAPGTKGTKLKRERKREKKPEERMIIKRKACIIINQIMYLLSECVHGLCLCVRTSERMGLCE